MTKIFKPLKLEMHYDENFPLILCPQCKNENVHITKTVIKLQDVQKLQIAIDKLDKHMPKYKGTITLTHETEPNGYDYAIALYYECENGCEGIILIHHHEGNTFLWHKKIEKS
jgi:hypothetical protein